MDRHAFAIRGEEAVIKWGYHVAATLAQWSFTGSGAGGGQVTARAVARDAFRLGQAPLTLVLHLIGHVDGPGRVTWPVLDVVEDGAKVMVTVGPCERTARNG